jgi:cell division protease FtsH
VKKFVQGGYDTAAAILDKHSEALIKIAEMLLEREILDGAEVLSLIKGDTLPPRQPDGGAEDHTQQVIRPEGGRRLPGLSEGERPQPA